MSAIEIVFYVSLAVFVGAFWFLCWMSFRAFNDEEKHEDR